MADDPNAPLPADLPYARPYPMHYAALTLPGRPGILTAVAILDLVLASLALPCNFGLLAVMNVLRQYAWAHPNVTIPMSPALAAMPGSSGAIGQVY